MSVDVLCIGETMAAIAPVDPGGLEAATRFVIHPAGAESNVAQALAGLGHHVAWASRLGSDALGNRLLASVRDSGVDVSQVSRGQQPTGVMVKDATPTGSAITYYRRGSAATAMGPEVVDSLAALAPRWVHVTGITPALSASCAELVRRIVLDRALARAVVSFDVNFRPGLWPADEAAEPLRALADAADVAFVGRDEGERLWGASTPDKLRELLPRVATLVVKDAAAGVTVFAGTRRLTVPALLVDVVEPVGAGDSFAAGWLSGALRGLDHERSARLAHLVAAQALVSVADQGRVPGPDEVAAALAVDADGWRSWRCAECDGSVGPP